jgi:predicted RNA-binding Zn-ribbon protein involved in translation (DUF1610 family)
MAISFSCPRCGKKLKAPDDAAGKSSRCPGCGSAVTCPEPIYDAELVDPQYGPNPFDDLDGGQPYAMTAEPAEASTAEVRKPCPMCGEMIVATAAKCRFCGEVFDPTLKKARKKSGRYGPDDESLTSGDVVLAVLCSGIGCIIGLVWMIQGKPKGGKMLAISIAMNVAWGLVRVALQTAVERGGP